MAIFRSWVGAALLLGAAPLLSAGCNSAAHAGGTSCHYETWRGRCKLQAVRTVRQIERFPQSYVVVEALYQPLMVEGLSSPPTFTKQTFAPAENELDLTEHLRKFPEVECAVQSPVADPCAPQMQAAVPEFVPGAARADTGPVGCAKIERSDNPPVPPSASLPGPFQFDDASSAETPDVVKLADDAARAIQENPKIECVAIKGQSAPGEPFILATERAQTVRRLLEARGIAHTRVTIFEPTAPTYTASPDDQPVLAEHRRVHLSVVVYGK
jgi:hypothetical protein